MEKEIIIYQEWGGLGDNLAHTTIPLLCKKYGYDCYLSKHNKFNNQETYDLLYKDLNLPLTDKIYPDWLHNYPKPTSSDWNHIRSIQLGYGFPEAPYSYPVIQYTPKYIEELKAGAGEYGGMDPLTSFLLTAYSLNELFGWITLNTFSPVYSCCIIGIAT